LVYLLTNVDVDAILDVLPMDVVVVPVLLLLALVPGDDVGPAVLVKHRLLNDDDNDDGTDDATARR
jgi:L-fucose mutarotase/ribose pyranase (RbsD/FucU family)